MSYIELTHHAWMRRRNNGKRNGRRVRKLQLLREHPFCSYCGEKLTEKTATIDHIVPRAKGGTDAYHNLTLACQWCNQVKGCVILEEVKP